MQIRLKVPGLYRSLGERILIGGEIFCFYSMNFNSDYGRSFDEKVV